MSQRLAQRELQDADAFVGDSLDKAVDGDAYKLQGRKVSKSTKSVRIQNGRKMVRR